LIAIQAQHYAMIWDNFKQAERFQFFENTKNSAFLQMKKTANTVPTIRKTDKPIAITVFDQFIKNQGVKTGDP